jgi:hypothetical protein
LEIDRISAPLSAAVGRAAIRRAMPITKKVNTKPARNIFDVFVIVP